LRNEGANMSENAPDRKPEHWVFGDYLVFANNHHAARRIYESMAEHRDGRVLFGSITLDDGTNGYWTMVRGRETAHTTGADALVRGKSLSCGKKMVY
jgi:hypothetical protein